MTKEELEQERKEMKASQMRPRSAEENEADTEFMEALYQEDLKKAQQPALPPKQPSPQAIEIAAKMLANKAMRQQQEHQGKSSGTTQ